MLDSRRALRILRADFPDLGRIFSSPKEYDAKKLLQLLHISLDENNALVI